MPELPEVETIRRQLAPNLVGHKIIDAGSHWSDKFTPATKAEGTKFVDIRRRGKYLILGLNNDHELVIHLGMTGQLRLQPTNEAEDDPYLRAWWDLSNNQTLTFKDVRRFGRIRYVTNGNYSDITTLAAAGPEPWDPTLTEKEFWMRLTTSRRKLKTNLLSQRPIAGVGNIYADEALWIAEINPSSTQVGQKRAGRLLDALKDVLEQGIENGGTTLRDYRQANGSSGSNQTKLLCYGRAGQPCLRCQTLLVSKPIDARTTTWCPNCQQR